MPISSVEPLYWYRIEYYPDVVRNRELVIPSAFVETIGSNNRFLSEKDFEKEGYIVQSFERWDTLRGLRRLGYSYGTDEIFKISMQEHQRNNYNALDIWLQ